LSRKAVPALPFRPIGVETDVPGRLRSINPVDAAAKLMVGDDWPAGKRGSVGVAPRPVIRPWPVWTPPHRRAAFIRAAKEAEIFVREGDAASKPLQCETNGTSTTSPGRSTCWVC